MRLADAVAPLFPDVTPLQAGLDHYGNVFLEEHEAMQAAKFGFLRHGPDEAALITEAFELLQRVEIDFTRFFRALGEIVDVPGEASDDASSNTSNTSAVTLLGDVFYDPA